MWLKVVDGVPTFATHFVRVVVDRQNKEVAERLARWQVEANGIVVYPDDNLQEVLSDLKSLSFVFEVEPLTYDPAIVEKTHGIQYASRSEAVSHILNDSEPESMTIPNLLTKLRSLERHKEEPQTATVESLAATVAELQAKIAALEQAVAAKPTV